METEAGLGWLAAIFVKNGREFVASPIIIALHFILSLDYWL